MFARRLAAGLILLTAGGFAAAQTGPQLLTVFPPGAKAGATVEITFSGTGLDGDELLLFSGKGFTSEAVGKAKPEPKAKQPGQPPATVKFKVTAPKQTGTYDVRVVSKSGLSNPRAFVVGNLTEANETEPNNDVGQAQKIALDTTVNGIIATPTDVDYVTFRAKAGQNVVVYCLTTSIDSKMAAELQVISPDGKPIAANRGYRGGDAVLDFLAPTDGDYLVRLCQFAYDRGGPDHFYRLTVTTKEWVDAFVPPLDGGFMVTSFTRNGEGIKIGGSARERKSQLDSNRLIPPSAAMIDALDHPPALPGGNLLLHAENEIILDNGKNNTADTAQSVKLPCDIAGRIAMKNDRHWYAFDAKKGEVWTLEVFAERIGSPVDAYVRLTDEAGKLIAETDDGPESLSPNQFYTRGDDPARYRFAVPADGKYKVMVSARDAGTQFGVRSQYVLRIAKENPDYRLAVMPVTPHLPDAGTVPRGGAVLYNVYVFRMDGFNDAITLDAENLPPGVTCKPQVIGPGQTRGTLVLTADKDAKDWEGFITIVGTPGKVRHTVRPFSIIWPALGVQPNQPPPNVPMLTRMDRGPGLALAVRGDAPFALTPTQTELKAAAGGKVEVTLKVERQPGFKDGIQVFSATPTFGPRQQPNQPVPPVTTIPADRNEVKLALDVPANTPPGTYTLVLRGQSAAPPPKTPTARPVPTYPALPITVTIGKR